MERSFRFGRWKWLIINGRFHTPPGVFRSVLFHFVQRNWPRVSTCFGPFVKEPAPQVMPLWLDVQSLEGRYPVA